jgi:hypothetical protein
MYRLILNLLVIGSLALVPLKPLAQAQSAPSATVINADITSDTTWTQSGSPYQVQTIVTVHPGVTLTIEPGVQVTFADNTRLNVNGTLVAEGRPDSQILFTAANPTPGAWQGVWVYGPSGQPSSGNRLKYVTMEYGGGGIANGANLYVSDGDINISYSIFRNGSQNGLTTWNNVVADVSDTQFTGNQGYAALFSDPASLPVLAHLAGSGNGVNVIALGGILHPITGTNLWTAAGLPYQLVSSMTVSPRSKLIIEPGVEVRFASHARLDIAGSLVSAGTIDHPILITAVTKIPGSWDGLTFVGPYNTPALGDFRYTTVEYGGGGFYAANIYVSTGRVTIDHSTIRNSSADGLRLDAFSSQSSIQASQITGNAAYGVRNKDTHPPATVIASDNFWGDASGPVSDGVCNPGAKGNRVSTNVVFQPFMGDSSTDPGAVPEIGAFSLAIKPHQWYFPANGTPLYVDLLVYDGKGQPAAGRKVSLTTSLGTVQVGEATDPNGRTFAILRSSAAGDATLTATLADLNGCESALSQTAVVTFTPGHVDVPGMTGALSPYVNTSLTIDPLPVMVGVPTRLRATLTNPYDFDVSVDATFGFAQAGIGLVFGPAGEVKGFVIPAKATRTMEVLWNPPISGHYCIDLEGTIYKAGAAAASHDPVPPIPLNSLHWTTNLDSAPGTLKPPEVGDIINKSENAQNWIGDSSFILTTLTDFASHVTGFIQNQLVGNILGFINQAGGVVSCAMRGGDNCGGWSGPSLQLPGGSLGSLNDDPPRQDYKVVAVPETLNLPTLEPGAGMPAGRAAAINDFMTASAQLATMEIATVVSFDRYSGAIQAGDQTWASIQANAYVAYLKQTGQDLLDNQKAIQALIAEIHAEGYTDMIVTEADFKAYQDRLRAQGWSNVERQAAGVAGVTDEGLELIRQSIINADPATAAGSQLDALQARADFYGQLGNAILNPPSFGFATSGHGHSPAAQAPAPNHLVRLYPTTETIQVGNPLTQTATIDLKVRPLGLPSDWVISLSQDKVTLDPGQHITLTVGIQPGLPLVQGTQSALAIEGYVGSQLIGGYAIDLAAPSYMDYQTPFHVDLPLMVKP